MRLKSSAYHFFRSPNLQWNRPPSPLERSITFDWGCISQGNDLLNGRRRPILDQKV